MLKLLNFSKTLAHNCRHGVVQQSKQFTPIAIQCALNSRCGSTFVPSVQPLAKTASEVFQNINQSAISERLFAVVQVCGKQFKVTEGDIIIIEGYWAPDIGDQIKLEKVLAVGGNSFSVIGRPLVDNKLVEVNATIIEKTLSHTRTHFKKKRRKQFMRINFYRNQNTMVRINSIDLKNNV